MSQSSFLLAILAIASLFGCATTQSHPLQGPVYGAQETRFLTTNDLATVYDVRPVIIQAERSSAGSYTGAAVGTALGGLLGNHIGKGNGRQAATILLAGIGGAAGAAAGGAAASQLGQTQGIEVIVRRANGQLQSVIQSINNRERFAPGQLVRLVQAPGGWHVSPL